MSETKKYAGFWIRFCAGVLDIAFLIFPFAVISFSFGLADINSIGDSLDSSSPHSSTLNFISYGISIIYLGYFLSSKKQATIGKRILGIYVGNPDGSKLSLQKSIWRALASILTSATLGIGFLLVIFTKEKTAMHDILCNTRVFCGKKND